MNNMFDMNFMGSNAAPSSSNLALQSPFDQFDVPGTYDTGFSGTGSSVFAPLTTTAPTAAFSTGPATSMFAPLTSTPQPASISAMADHAYSGSASNGFNNLVDYSKHFSSEYSSVPETDLKPDEEKVEGKCAEGTSKEEEEEEDNSLPPPVLDIIINNVVCSFSTRCHLNLKKIAREANHVIYKPENGVGILVDIFSAIGTFYFCRWCQ
jgi:transcription initiation factor TFIID TATA-box-binding protein